MKTRHTREEIRRACEDEQQAREERRFQRRLAQFRKIINAKNVAAVEKRDGRLIIQFNDGQILKCRGPLVDAVGVE